MEAENLFLLTSSMWLFLSRRSEGSHQIFHEISWIDSKLKPWQSTTSRSKTWKTCRTQRMWIRAQREFLGFSTTRDGRCQGWWRVSMGHHWDIPVIHGRPTMVTWNQRWLCAVGDVGDVGDVGWGRWSVWPKVPLPVCIPLFALDWPCIYGFGVGRFLRIVQPFGCRIYIGHAKSVMTSWFGGATRHHIHTPVASKTAAFVEPALRSDAATSPVACSLDQRSLWPGGTSTGLVEHRDN